MDLLELIKSRRSIRAFTREMPSQETIRECLEAATWAPSATNQQPWEFIVATGAELKKINEITVENFADRMQDSDPFGNVPEPCRERQQEIFSMLLTTAEKAGVDANEIFQKSLCFFDAPVGVFFVTYKRNDAQYLLSAAAAIENFLLAAQAKGLGTCWLTVTVVCQEDIKKHLGISDNKDLLAGIAVGYPAPESPFNTFTRTRVSVENLTTWLGFTGR